MAYRVLPAYVVSGTELAYRAARDRDVHGAAQDFPGLLRYAPTRVLRDVRYRRCVSCYLPTQRPQPYRPATRCPVLKWALCYAVPGTDLETFLPLCYAIPGTDIGHTRQDRTKIRVRAPEGVKYPEGGGVVWVQAGGGKEERVRYKRAAWVEKDAVSWLCSLGVRAGAGGGVGVVGDDVDDDDDDEEEEEDEDDDDNDDDDDDDDGGGGGVGRGRRRVRDEDAVGLGLGPGPGL
eukprot:2304308-Rhodomonas_salina.1